MPKRAKEVLLGSGAVPVLVKRARYARGWTQQQLADRTGVSESTIVRLERGRGAPALPTVERLLAACGFGVELRLATLAADVDAVLDAAPADAEGRLWRAEELHRITLFLTLLTQAGVVAGVGGDVAAVLHGSPAPVRTFDLHLAPEDLGAARGALGRWFSFPVVDGEPADVELPQPGFTVNLRWGGVTWPVAAYEDFATVRLQPLEELLAEADAADDDPGRRRLMARLLERRTGIPGDPWGPG